MGWISRPPSRRTISFPAFFSFKPRSSDVGMIPCHLDGVGITQEIRGVQQVHVQGVAFDPLPAIDEPPERAQLPVHLQSERVLDRMDGAHLIRDRTDAADARQ